MIINNTNLVGVNLEDELVNFPLEITLNKLNDEGPLEFVNKLEESINKIIYTVCLFEKLMIFSLEL